MLNGGLKSAMLRSEYALSNVKVITKYFELPHGRLTTLNLVLGIWCLELGAWNLVLGIWCLEFGAWKIDGCKAAARKSLKS